MDEPVERDERHDERQERRPASPFASPWVVVPAGHLLFGLVGVWSAARGADPDRASVAPLVVPLVVSALAAGWCRADARVRGRPLSAGHVFVVFLLWPLALPAYLIQTRGWVGAAWSAGLLVSLVSVTICSGILTAVTRGG